MIQEGRLVAGLGVGILSMMVPVRIFISPTGIDIIVLQRGKVLCFNNTWLLPINLSRFTLLR